MRNELGDYVRSVREAKGLSRGEAVRLMGYRNVAKGANRLVAVERGEIPDEELMKKIVRALELDPEKVYECIRTMEERREDERQRWLDEPAPVQLYMRVIPGVVLSKILGLDVPEETAIKEACAEAKRLHCQCMLALDRRKSVWIDGDGNVTGRKDEQRGEFSRPYMTLKGGRKKFVLRLSGGSTSIGDVG
jgi:transcriptional regulator with XRE-family HTH domain